MPQLSFQSISKLLQPPLRYFPSYTINFVSISSTYQIHRYSWWSIQSHLLSVLRQQKSADGKPWTRYPRRWNEAHQNLERLAHHHWQVEDPQEGATTFTDRILRTFRMDIMAELRRRNIESRQGPMACVSFTTSRVVQTQQQDSLWKWETKDALERSHRPG